MDTSYLVTIALSCLIVLLTTIYLRVRRPPGFPPGPPFLPGLGTAAFVACPTGHADLVALLHSWKRQYGNVCGYSTGDRLAVVVSDYGVAKEVFVRDGKYVSDRARIGVPHLRESNPYHPKTGIMGGDYLDAKWRPLHRACQMALHELVDVPPRGNVTSRLEGRMARPLDALSGNIENQLKTSGDVVPPFTTYVTQFMLALLFGGDVKETVKEAEQLRVLREPLTGFTDHLLMKQNHLHHLVARLTGAARELLVAYKGLHSFLFCQLGEHQTREKKDQLQARDFIDHYLKDCAKSGVGEDDRIFLVLGEIIQHGIDPLVSILTCVINFLISRPKLQAEIQEKLSVVVGSKRQPKLNDRPSLGIIDAVVNETLRLTPPYVLSEAHRTCSKMAADGHTLPKNTMVYLNIWQVHRDPKVWPDPTDFKPDRFLNAAGRFVNKSEMVAFGMGRRVCVGEQVSRQLLFLTLANLLHKFTFFPPDGEPVSAASSPNDTAPTYRPLPFSVQATKRH